MSALTAAPASAVDGDPPVRPRSRRRRRWGGWAFMVPFVVTNLVVVFGPALATVGYAFTDWNGLSTPQFIGLDNFDRLFHDEEFWNAFRHNLVYVVFMVVVPVVMGLVGAFMLSRIRRFRLLFQTAFFIPCIVASVVNGAIWKYLLNPDVGIAVQLDKIGIHWLDGRYFLGDTSTALPTIMFVDNWQAWGFLVLIFLAAMQDVPQALYESARIDGAGRWQEFWYITIPSIRPTLSFVLLLSIIWALLAFDYAYVLTSGGPADSSMLMSILVNRNAFQLNQAGYASAMGLLMTVITVATIAFFNLLRRGSED